MNNQHLKTRNKYLFFAFFTFYFFSSLTCFSQVNDKDTNNSENKAKVLNKPTRAALLSALIPGAGQVYNKKYWKLPIIYGGLVTSAVVYNFNNKHYKRFRDNLTYLNDNNPETTVETEISGADSDGLKRARDYHRRYRDMTVIISFLLYGLNIVDAAVDAHLMEFNVKDDMTAAIKPKLINNNFNGVVPGVSFTLSLGGK